ncbi:MAG: zf-HC2 domain-containing protein [Leptolyngbyaceae cyanobacterium SM2_3_12]|nr:zf-HC2 domain-containing protein [Leptolyngbyaceae cyanobacterium SM2_3_12]
MSTSPYTPIQVRNLSQGRSQPPEKTASSLGLCQELDVLKRDRFELLSAYLDGEVTPEERQLVLVWLNNDPKAKGLYNRLLCLRKGFREGPSAPPCGDPEATVAGVFKCLNQRFQLVTMAGLGVAVIGTLNLLSGSPSSQSLWQRGLVSQPESLKIALDQPAFPIPEPSLVVPVDSQTIQHQGDLPIDSEL